MNCWKVEKAKVWMRFMEDLFSGKRLRIINHMWRLAVKKGYVVVTVQYISDNREMRHCIHAVLQVRYVETGRILTKHSLAVAGAIEPSLFMSLWVMTADNTLNNSSTAESLDVFLPEPITKLTSSLNEAVNVDNGMQIAF